MYMHMYMWNKVFFLAGHSGRLNHYRIVGQVVWIQRGSNYFKYLCILTVYIVYVFMASLCMLLCLFYGYIGFCFRVKCVNIPVSKYGQVVGEGMPASLPYVQQLGHK